MDSYFKQQINGIIKMIKEDSKKKLVTDFFLEDVKEFNRKINKLEKDMKDNMISQDEACFLVSINIKYILKKAHKIEEIISNGFILKRIKRIFRDQIKDFIFKSFLIRRGYSKPSGYPGDYKLIEMFYDNAPFSERVGFCGDKYILQDSYVEAVRIRKDMMKSELGTFIKNTKSMHLNIMNIGCGSCREIRELLSGLSFDKKLMFTLIDWDKEALEFTKESLSEYQRNANIKFKFMRENVISFYRQSNKYSKILKNQDLIYSTGLADYMPDLILGEIIKFCFSLLKEKGILTIAHKNAKLLKSTASDWFCDWHFCPRDEKDIKEILNGSLREYKYKLKILKEKTNHIFFIIVTKV